MCVNGSHDARAMKSAQYRKRTRTQQQLRAAYATCEHRGRRRRSAAVPRRCCSHSVDALRRLRCETRFCVVAAGVAGASRDPHSRIIQIRPHVHTQTHTPTIRVHRDDARRAAGKDANMRRVLVLSCVDIALRRAARISFIVTRACARACWCVCLPRLFGQCEVFS